MNRRLKRQMEYLRLLLSADKSWDFWTASNTGIFQNKIRIYSFSGQQLFTRDQLHKSIAEVKVHIRETRKALEKK